MSGLTVNAPSATNSQFNVSATSTAGARMLAAGGRLVLAVDTDPSTTANPFAPAQASATLAKLLLVTSNLSAPTGYQLSLGTQADSAGVGGYDLFLGSVVAAPEPTSLLLAAIAAGPLALLRRRRRVTAC